RVSDCGNRLLIEESSTTTLSIRCAIRCHCCCCASLGSKPALRMSASLWSFHLVLGLPTGRRPSGSASNICLTRISVAILPDGREEGAFTCTNSFKVFERDKAF